MPEERRESREPERPLLHGHHGGDRLALLVGGEEVEQGDDREVGPLGGKQLEGVRGGGRGLDPEGDVHGLGRKSRISVALVGWAGFWLAQDAAWVVALPLCPPPLPPPPPPQAAAVRARASARTAARTRPPRMARGRRHFLALTVASPAAPVP